MNALKTILGIVMIKALVKELELFGVKTNTLLLMEQNKFQVIVLKQNVKNVLLIIFGIVE